MMPGCQSAIEGLVRRLNGDILREFRMADDCVRHAGCLPKDYYPIVRRQIAACGAAALANATALACEVVALGGIPVLPGYRKPVESDSRIIPAWQAGARAMLDHYRRRLRMADRMGLHRLRAVFEQIVSTKEKHLAHSRFMEAGDPPGRYLQTRVRTG